jgi:hypothetical protein
MTSINGSGNTPYEVTTYIEALKELTFNSKPHITNLTIIAQENIKYVKEIVREIEARIRMAPPNEKLPSLYLLDSIIKNIGEPYITEFSHNLANTFCGAFESVKDDQTRNQYLRLLKTWPQYFPIDKIHQIEQRIHQIALMSMPKTRPIQPKQLNLPGDGRNIHVNPKLFQPSNGRPPNMRSTPELIREFHALLQKTDPSVLRQPHIASQLSQLNAMISQYAARTRTSPPLVGALPIAPSTGPAFPPKSVSPTPPTYPSTTPTPQPAELINTLLSMGLLGGSREQKVPNTATQGNNDVRKTPAVRKLYDSFSLQCSTCALRFNDQEQLDKHLDNHYAISSRRNKNKVLSRKWHQTEDEWIKLIDDVVVESPGAIFFSQLQGSNTVDSKAETTTISPETENEGVPVDDQQPQCPVCHESFQLGRDSNTDEWIYKDTKRDSKTGVIVHRICMPAYKRQFASDTITRIKAE